MKKLKIGDKVKFLDNSPYVPKGGYQGWPENYYGIIKEILPEGHVAVVEVYEKDSNMPSHIFHSEKTDWAFYTNMLAPFKE